MPFFENIFSTPKERTDFFISVVVIAFFGLGILSFIKPDLTRENFAVAGEKMQKETTAKIIEKEITTSTSLPVKIQQKEKEWVDDLRRKSIENTSLVTAIPQKVTGAADSVASSRISHNLDIAVVEEEKPTKIFSEVKDTIGSSVDLDTTVVFNEQEEDTLSSKVASDSSVIQEQNFANDEKVDGDCAIFIGAFKSKTNANLLLKKLEDSERYHSFSNYEKGYQVVGVRVSCNQEKAQKILEEIKQQYSEDAWFTALE